MQACAAPSCIPIIVLASAGRSRPTSPGPVSQCEDLGARLHRERRHEPGELAAAFEILKRHPETTFSRPIRLVYAIQFRCIPGFVPRGSGDRFVGRGYPIRAEGLCNRAAVSVVPKIR